VMPLSEGGIETLSNTQFEEVFRTNVSSVQAVTSVLLPLLERGQTRKVVNM
jgi:NAD(P)-dependent dehydrogenase (short-subunit alcohol dehydrogenase family)